MAISTLSRRPVALILGATLNAILSELTPKSRFTEAFSSNFVSPKCCLFEIKSNPFITKNLFSPIRGTISAIVPTATSGKS